MMYGANEGPYKERKFEYFSALTKQSVNKSFII